MRNKGKSLISLVNLKKLLEDSKNIVFVAGLENPDSYIEWLRERGIDAVASKHEPGILKGLPLDVVERLSVGGYLFQRKEWLLDL